MEKGTYTNTELINSIIVDLNNMIKEEISGQYINACNMVNQIAQKLVCLQSGIDKDIKNRERTIEILKQELRDAGQEVTDYTAQEFFSKTEKDGGQ